MSETNGVVQVTNLRVVLSSGQTIVEDVSFTIRPGEILGVVGESGSGKTTVSMALLDYARDGARIAGGKVRVAGRDVLGADAKTSTALRGRTVSYVSQDPTAAFNPALRLRSQLQQLSKAHGLAQDRAALEARITEVMNEVGLPATPEFLCRFPHQLSGGQLQRVGLAMAILLKPPVIVLDEPTTGLDVTTQSRVLALVRNLCTRHGIAALYVTHDLAVIAEIADVVMVMQSGRIVESGPVEAVFQQPRQEYTRQLLSAVPDICTDVAPSPEEQASDEGVVLKVSDVSVAYGSNAVLESISFDVRQGECLALVGESGSGKSTLSKALIGLHGAFGGSVRLLGQEVPARADRRPRSMLRDMQYIFQSPLTSLNPRRTVAESIALVHKAVGGSARERRQAVMESLDKVGLRAECAAMYPNQLSGGERQRVSIARALVGKPRLLICDEVTSALDVIVQESILELLRDLQAAEDLSMIFVTHNLAVVSNLADRVIVLDQGRIVETGPTHRVLNQPEHAYTRQLVENSLSISAVADRRWSKAV